MIRMRRSSLLAAGDLKSVRLWNWFSSKTCFSVSATFLRISSVSGADLMRASRVFSFSCAIFYVLPDCFLRQLSSYLYLLPALPVIAELSFSSLFCRRIRRFL